MGASPADTYRVDAQRIDAGDALLIRHIHFALISPILLCGSYHRSGSGNRLQKFCKKVLYSGSIEHFFCCSVRIQITGSVCLRRVSLAIELVLGVQPVALNSMEREGKTDQL